MSIFMNVRNCNRDHQALMLTSIQKTMLERGGGEREHKTNNTQTHSTGQAPELNKYTGFCSVGHNYCKALRAAPRASSRTEHSALKIQPIPSLFASLAVVAEPARAVPLTPGTWILIGMVPARFRQKKTTESLSEACLQQVLRTEKEDHQNFCNI